MKSKEQIKKDMEQFAKDIPKIIANGDYSKIKKLHENIRKYIKDNNVTSEQNYVRSSGYGEMLEMALSAHEWVIEHE